MGGGDKDGVGHGFGFLPRWGVGHGGRILSQGALGLRRWCMRFEGVWHGDARSPFPPPPPNDTLTKSSLKTSDLLTS